MFRWFTREKPSIKPEEDEFIIIDTEPIQEVPEFECKYFTQDEILERNENGEQNPGRMPWRDSKQSRFGLPLLRKFFAPQQLHYLMAAIDASPLAVCEQLSVFLSRRCNSSRVSPMIVLTLRIEMNTRPLRVLFILNSLPRVFHA